MCVCVHAHACVRMRVCECVCVCVFSFVYVQHINHCQSVSREEVERNGRAEKKVGSSGDRQEAQGG